MTTTADDLDQLEEWIQKLHVEFEKYFAGVEKRAPTVLQTKVVALVRRHAYGEVSGNVLRFRAQSLTARYNTLNELWSKRMRALEEGRPITGVRGRTAPPPPPAAPRAAARAAAGGGEGQVRIAAPEADQEAVRALFDRFIEARRQTGETAAVRYESFERLICDQAARILKQKGAQAVDFRLETKGGKVSLKAKPVK